MTDTDIIAFLTRSGLIDPGTTPLMKPLTGGVSSDIWRVETASNAICVKRALPTLKTEKEWHAPVERNANEADWFRKAAEIVPGAVPELLAEDRGAGMFAMAYLDPVTNPLWKKELRDGRVTPDSSVLVGTTLGKMHATTANNDIVAERFATDEIFHAIRIEPYFLRTAETCPDVAPRLKALARVTAETRRVLVHGDVSPKNILSSARGPVFLDAECAWYGDPAFDLAFCLNHLLHQVYMETGLYHRLSRQLRCACVCLSGSYSLGAGGSFGNPHSGPSGFDRFVATARRRWSTSRMKTEKTRPAEPPALD